MNDDNNKQPNKVVMSRCFSKLISTFAKNNTLDENTSKCNLTKRKSVVGNYDFLNQIKKTHSILDNKFIFICNSKYSLT